MKTLKDVSSIETIAVSSGQDWNSSVRDVYMENRITSVRV